MATVNLWKTLLRLPAHRARLVLGRRWGCVALVLALALASCAWLWLAPPPGPPPPPPAPEPQQQEEPAGGPPSLVVHLDMKGAPPPLPFALHWLRLVALEGADAVLVEWEDAFPWEGSLANLSAPHAYSRADAARLLREAAALRLQMIPLVQTFGHLEFALKRPAFAHLRELPGSPQALCPMHPHALALVREMLRQVMRLHLSAPPAARPRFLHLGCDEVRQLALCPRCALSGLRREEVFARWVSVVARAAAELFPGVRPLVWDDMLRGPRPLDAAQRLNLTALVQPVVWVYSPALAPMLTPFLWFSYVRLWGSDGVWAAATFRGASGETAAAPDVWGHARNVLAWRRLQRHPPRAPGPLLLTGWARYDHFEVLCELLSVSVPSLVLALRVARLQQGEAEAAEEEAEGAWPLQAEADRAAEAALAEHGPLLERWRRDLGCPAHRSRPLPRQPMQWGLVYCRFLGVEAFRAVEFCERKLQRADRALATYEDPEPIRNASTYALAAHHKGEGDGWSLRVWRAGAAGAAEAGAAGAEELRATLTGLKQCRRLLRQSLRPYVHPSALQEWLEERVQPLWRVLRRGLRFLSGNATGAPAYWRRLGRRPGLGRRWWPPDRD